MGPLAIAGKRRRERSSWRAAGRGGNSQDRRHQADGTTDLASENHTRRYPLDGAEPTHNRPVAGSRPASPTKQAKPGRYLRATGELALWGDANHRRRQLACSRGMEQEGTTHDRSKRVDQTLRRPAGRGRAVVPGQAGPGDRVPGAERGREVDHHAADPGAAHPQPRQCDRQRPALPGPAGAAAGGGGAAGRLGGGRGPNRPGPPDVAGPEQPDPAAPGWRGARAGRPGSGRGPPGRGLLARDGPAAGDRRRPPRRPRGADLRRAGQRARHRGDPLDPGPA